jgi:hypothetical protein
MTKEFAPTRKADMQVVKEHIFAKFNRSLPETCEYTDIKDFEVKTAIIDLYLEKLNATSILAKLHEHGDERFARVTIQTVVDTIRDYEKSITNFVTDNPEILDKKLDMIVRHIDSLDRIEQAEWELYNKTKDNLSSVQIANGALKNITSIVMEKAKLQQLIGNDRELREELTKVKDANHKLILLVRTTVHECPVCKKKLDEYLRKHMRIVSI